jgi:hypothetical protein
LNKKLALSAILFFILVFVIIYMSIRTEEVTKVNMENNNRNPSQALTLSDGPRIISVAQNQNSVGKYEKLELSVDIKALYHNPYDPDQIDLHAQFESPKGIKWTINGFYDGKEWKIRFSPNEEGTWKYQVALIDKKGSTKAKPQSFDTVASKNHGWIGVSQKNKRYLSYADGTSFYGVGVAYPWGVEDQTLDTIASNGGNLITYWNGNYDSAGSGGGVNQLESLTSGIGKYDADKGHRIDELVGAFQSRNLHMSFVIWPHDSLASTIEWPKTWDKNAYSTLGEAIDFYKNEQMWKYQQKLYRYIIARWGYSSAIGIWDIVCEINGTDGWSLGDQNAANEWLTKSNKFIKDNDPYGHPTMGSMAGNLEDYWDHAYRTLDIADRENYYDLSIHAYAADIQKRWANYQKPLFIGETGNITDEVIYHNANWTSLTNGLASSPIWWAVDKVDPAMFAQMKAFSTFVSDIDFATSQWKPLIGDSKSIHKQLDKTLSLEDGVDVSDWSRPDWADANKDENGILYTAMTDSTESPGTIVSEWLFQTGGFSQGVIQQNVNFKDWSVYDEFLVDIYPVKNKDVTEINAKTILFPDGQWNEAKDQYGVKLKPGQWNTIKVSLANSAGIWKDKEVTIDDLKAMNGWGIKLYTEKTSKDAKPMTVKIRNPRLLSKNPPAVTVKESRSWIIKGDQKSFGWMITDQGNISGKSALVSGLDDGKVRITWFDTWAGKTISESEQHIEAGKLILVAPKTAHPDVAFVIINL